MIQARARVQVTLEIPVQDTWGEDCAFTQVCKQAKESALNALRSGVAVNGLANTNNKYPLKVAVVGEPQVTVILVEEQK